MANYPVIIGRSESIDIIDTAKNVPAKIDTGAFWSAIHSSNVRVEKDKDGSQVLKATLLGHTMHPGSFEVEFKEFQKIIITNSFGDQETRFGVSLRVKLGPKIVTTVFTLADRSKNFFPILVGRTLLKRRFLVDVSNSGISNMSKIEKTYKGPVPDDLAK